MGFWDLFRAEDINKGFLQYRNTVGAILLDVRTPEEFSQGHLPHSVNLPLQKLSAISSVTENRQTPLFVYCQSGARSRQAVAMLRQMGYTEINNIGGISGYCGKVER